MVISPDDKQATHFLADLYSSTFTQDIKAGNIAIDIAYSMLHCAACEERGFTMAKENCLSGGRYCMKSSRLMDLSGEVMLVQTIKNICAEVELEKRGQEDKIGEYWWTFNSSCVEEMRPECSNAILKKLGIKNEVFACIKNSFEDSARKLDSNISQPKILLQDNSILRREMMSFSKIENYAHFPMVKVNGMIFYGPTRFRAVMGFICTHVNDNLKGCESGIGLPREIVLNKPSQAFKYAAIFVVVLAVSMVLFVCRNKLKAKFDADLAYKIDQSVSEYLKRTGSDL